MACQADPTDPASTYFQAMKLLAILSILASIQIVEALRLSVPLIGRNHAISTRQSVGIGRSASSSSSQLPPARFITSIRGGGGNSNNILPPPRLSTWIAPGSLCALAYAMYNLFIKRASNHIMDPLLGGVLLQFVAAILGSFMYIVKCRMTGTTLLAATSWSRAGIQWSMAAGLAVGLAEMLSFYVSAKGVQAMQSIPVIIGGSVLLGTVLGSVWLKEAISWKGWMGVVLISAGIALVGMDPGSSMH